MASARKALESARDLIDQEVNEAKAALDAAQARYEQAVASVHASALIRRMFKQALFDKLLVRRDSVEAVPAPWFGAFEELAKPKRKSATRDAEGSLKSDRPGRLAASQVADHDRRTWSSVSGP